MFWNTSPMEKKMKWHVETEEKHIVYRTYLIHARSRREAIQRGGKGDGRMVSTSIDVQKIELLNCEKIE